MNVKQSNHCRLLLAILGLLVLIALACGGSADDPTFTSEPQVDKEAAGQDPLEELPTSTPEPATLAPPTPTPTPSPVPVLYTPDEKACQRPAWFQTFASIQGQNPLEQLPVGEAVLARLTGAESPVYYAAISRGGRFAVTLEGNRARLWSAGTGRPSPIRQFGSQEELVTGQPAFSPDGRLLAIPFTGGVIRFINTGDGTEAFSFAAGAGGGDPRIGTLAFDPEGSRLAVADGATALLYNVDDGRELARFEGVLIENADIGPSYVDGHALEITTVAFTPNGQGLLTAAIDGTVRLWELDTGRPLRCFEDEIASRSAFRSAAISHDGRLVAGQQGGSIYLWDAQTGTILRQIAMAGGEPFSSVVFQPDQLNLLTSSEDRTARVWDAEDGRLLGLTHHPAAVNWAGFDPAGSRIIAALGSGFSFGAEPVNETWIWDASHPDLLLAAEAYNLFEKALALLAEGDVAGAQTAFAQAKALNPYPGYDLNDLAMRRNAAQLVE